MPRRRRQQDDDTQLTSSSSPKRSRDENLQEKQSSPSRGWRNTREAEAQLRQDADELSAEAQIDSLSSEGLENDDGETPTALKQPLASRSKLAGHATPRKSRASVVPPRNGAPGSPAATKSWAATPTKTPANQSATPRRTAADRSARRKSARTLIQNVVHDSADEVEEYEDEGNIVREIYEDSLEGSEEGGSEAGDLGNDDVTVANGSSLVAVPAGRPTSLKTSRKQGRKGDKSLTPPNDLPAHELYFTHNKPGRPKTSDNTLRTLSLLTHEDFFSIRSKDVDPHCRNVEDLESLHTESFPQWAFELSQGFNLCLFGFGSKRRVLHNFASYLHETPNRVPDQKTVVVNGYAHMAMTRDIFGCIGTALGLKLKTVTTASSAMIRQIATRLSSSKLLLNIIVHSIDAISLRKMSTQALLAQLAAIPQVHLVCSADTPDFPLMWDVGARSAFDFVFHDCTTFAPFSIELDVIDEVHGLIGRKARRVNGREGVAFVLRSLPENAKNLFRLLVGEILVATEESRGEACVEEVTGIEYRMLYNKAVEEFICSSEMAFRTLLKEFHDHQIIISHNDALGTELLSVPFEREELESILEDLMS